MVKVLANNIFTVVNVVKVSANNIFTLVDVVKASVEHPLTQDKSEVPKGVKYTTQIRYPRGL